MAHQVTWHGELPPLIHILPTEAGRSSHWERLVAPDAWRRKRWIFCDSMAYDGHRYIYAGTVAGVRCRIDTQTGAVEKLAHVMPAGRLPAMGIHDETLYVAGGLRGRTEALAWRIGSGHIEQLCPLIDTETGKRPERVHELAIGSDGTLYLAENDNHARSSYLWTMSPSKEHVRRGVASEGRKS